MKLIALLSMLFTVSGFAGDSYLLCEDSAEYEITNVYVGDNGVVTGSHIVDTDYIFYYEFDATTLVMDARLIDMHGAGTREYKKVALDYFVEQHLFRGITCYLAD